MSNDYPSKVKPYIFHGIRLKHSDKECSGECVFCGREGKFSVNASTGQFKCWSCDEAGNVYSFIRKFHELCVETMTPQDYREMVENRGLLDSQSLIEWELCKSVTTGRWLVPGYNPQRQLVSLYQRFKQEDGGYRLTPTSTLGHHIHGMNLWDSSKPLVYICEGPWDALVLWECLTRAKNTEEGVRATASRTSSLYSQCNVIAVPGAGIFFEGWLQLFEDRVVNIMFDSDHPRKNRVGKPLDGAGVRGVKRIAEMFANSRYKPQEVNCLMWGEEGYDLTRKSGFDVRDYLLSA